MKRITLRSGEDVKAFIEAQEEARQQACAVFIASRAALRVAPYAIQFYEFEELAMDWSFDSIGIWRSLLTSDLSSKMRTLELKIAANIAAKASIDLAETNIFIYDEVAVSYANTVAFAAASAAENITKPALATVTADSFAANAKFLLTEMEHDAALWLEHASQRDGTLVITIAPLWSNENPLEHDWYTLREKLLVADTPDPRWADWSFWVKWYDDILAGHPHNWNMLHEIATTDAIDWNASAREVNDTINGIVEKFQNVKSDQDKVVTVSKGQKVSPPPKVDGGHVAESLQRHAPALPPALDAISFIIENEIKRLQEKNYQDDLEAAESKRLINVFMSILRATEEMSAHVPVDRKVEEEDTEAAKTLIKVYHELFSSWPRENAPDVVDATCRAGLTAGATGIMVMCGAPVMVAVGIAGLAYGGPRLIDVGKTLKDALKE